jgi:hypothetical protein
MGIGSVILVFMGSEAFQETIQIDVVSFFSTFGNSSFRCLWTRTGQKNMAKSRVHSKIDSIILNIGIKLQIHQNCLNS